MTLQEPPSKENVERAFDQRVRAARAAFDAGRVAEAARLFAELAREFPAHPLPHANLGMTLRRLGKLEAAVASYRRALQLAPDNPGIMSSLGNALRALGRLSEAERLSDWRWMDYRDDSPWYPTMRLFRQPRPDDFVQPVERVREAIAQFVAAAAEPRL